MAAELNANGTFRKQFIYVDSVNSPEYMFYNGKKYLFVKDHRESILQVVDSSTGEVMQKMKYSEFGEVILDTNPGFQPFGFAGGLYDYETKLVRFGARDYDGSTGRWLSKDPIRFDGGDANLYGYVLNDPVNFVDPTGLYTWDEFKKDTQKFVRDVKDFMDKMERLGDQLKKIREAAYCKMFPKECGTDPADKPIPEDPDINPKNQCR